jgi:hypothetical protein
MKSPKFSLAIVWGQVQIGKEMGGRETSETDDKWQSLEWSGSGEGQKFVRLSDKEAKSKQSLGVDWLLWTVWCMEGTEFLVCWAQLEDGTAYGQGAASIASVAQSPGDSDTKRAPCVFRVLECHSPTAEQLLCIDAQMLWRCLCSQSPWQFCATLVYLHGCGAPTFLYCIVAMCETHLVSSFLLYFQKIVLWR